MNRVRLVVAGLLLVSAVSGVGAIDDAAPADLVVVGTENGSSLWPYTSAGQTTERRTLAINVIAVGDPDDVERHLRRGDEDWRARPAPGLDEDRQTEFGGIDEEAIPWRTAHASTRYTYVRPADGSSGRWVEESYQLYDGAYLGARYHIRAYESPDESRWTAIQAHREYWDWFRLRHTVTGTSDARRHVEVDLRDEPFVDRVWRRYLDNEGPFGDGWATVIEFVAGIVPLVLASRGRSLVVRGRSNGRTWLEQQRHRVRDYLRRRGPETLRASALALAIVAIYLGVRFGGITAEETFRTVSPKVIAGVLYPVVAVGLPAVAVVGGRRLSLENAFLAGVLGLATAFFLNYAALGVTSLPITLIVHRLALVLAIGLIAAGGAHGRRSELTWLGGGGWLVALLFALAGML
jgi:hypothetical protein